MDFHTSLNTPRHACTLVTWPVDGGEGARQNLYGLLLEAGRPRRAVLDQAGRARMSAARGATDVHRRAAGPVGLPMMATGTRCGNGRGRRRAHVAEPIRTSA